MIESAENAIQLVLLAVCAVYSFGRALSTGRRIWTLAGLYFSVYALGDLYWQLFLIFFGHSPEFSFIPYLSWYAGYVFLWMLLQELRKGQRQRKHIRVLWCIPVFTAGMCLYFMQYGAYFSNAIAAVLMGMLLWGSAAGLLQAGHGAEKARTKPVFAVIFLFCLAEYGAWTSSCIWTGETLRNPYYWFDMALTVVSLLLVPAVRKSEASLPMEAVE